MTAIVIPRTELTAEYEDHILRAVNACRDRGLLPEPEGTLFSYQLTRDGKTNRIMVRLFWVVKATGEHLGACLIDPTDLIAAVPFGVIQGRE